MKITLDFYKLCTTIDFGGKEKKTQLFFAILVHSFCTDYVIFIQRSSYYLFNTTGVIFFYAKLVLTCTASEKSSFIIFLPEEIVVQSFCASYVVFI